MMFKWKSFPIDLPSFLDWLKSTYGVEFGAFAGPELLQIWKTGMVAGNPATISDSEKTVIMAHWNGLDQTAEATKRALPSRKKLLEKGAFEQAVKAFVATKDWSAMSVAERKFAMGSVLINTEYDTLTTS